MLCHTLEARVNYPAAGQSLYVRIWVVVFTSTSRRIVTRTGPLWLWVIVNYSERGRRKADLKPWSVGTKHNSNSQEQVILHTMWQTPLPSQPVMKESTINLSQSPCYNVNSMSYQQVYLKTKQTTSTIIKESTCTNKTEKETDFTN